MHTKRKQNLTRMLMQSLPMLKCGLTNHKASFESCAVSHPGENRFPISHGLAILALLVLWFNRWLVVPRTNTATRESPMYNLDLDGKGNKPINVLA